MPESNENIERAIEQLKQIWFHDAGYTAWLIVLGFNHPRNRSWPSEDVAQLDEILKQFHHPPRVQDEAVHHRLMRFFLTEYTYLHVPEESGVHGLDPLTMKSVPRADALQTVDAMLSHSKNFVTEDDYVSEPEFGQHVDYDELRVLFADRFFGDCDSLFYMCETDSKTLQEAGPIYHSVFGISSDAIGLLWMGW